jgi:hypothetical protein
MTNETKLTPADLALYYRGQAKLIRRAKKLDSFQGFAHVGQVVVIDSVLIASVEQGLYVVKPILRPLSDMTLDEAAFCAKEMFCDEAEAPDERLTDMAKIAIRDNFGGPHLASWRIGFLITRYLMSKHFDLFGWIESGLAIDKTKTK